MLLYTSARVTRTVASCLRYNVKTDGKIYFNLFFFFLFGTTREKHVKTVLFILGAFARFFVAVHDG